MKINEKLKHRRIELSLTMLEVAKKVGVSEATISRWESGDIANMRRDKIVSLAKALQVPPAFIMDEDESFNYTSQEINIINKYKKLNHKGKPKAETYIDDLLVNPQYTVPDDANSVPEEHIELKLVAENKNSVPPIVDDITHT